MTTDLDGILIGIHVEELPTELVGLLLGDHRSGLSFVANGAADELAPEPSNGAAWRRTCGVSATARSSVIITAFLQRWRRVGPPEY
jgi:hypothetical protein